MIVKKLAGKLRNQAFLYVSNFAVFRKEQATSLYSPAVMYTQMPAAQLRKDLYELPLLFHEDISPGEYNSSDTTNNRHMSETSTNAESFDRTCYFQYCKLYYMEKVLTSVQNV